MDRRAMVNPRPLTRAVCLLLAWGALPALAQNLVVNSGFEHGTLAGWMPYHAVSCKNLGALPEFQVRNDPCDVWIPDPCYDEGDWHARLQGGSSEVGARAGMVQVVAGLDPRYEYRLAMSGMIRSTRSGGDVLRLWWLPRAFSETIPTPFDACNPANFPADAVVVAEWTGADGQPGEHWTHKWGTVTSEDGMGTIFADVEVDDPDWGWAIYAAYIDNVGFEAWVPLPTETPAADIDGDRVPDALECDNLSCQAGQSNRHLVDSDGDGLLDGIEDANRNGRRDAGETATRNPDTDSDLFEDGIEALLGQDPLAADSSYADADADGLPDSQDPRSDRTDADGDGFDDGYEAAWFEDATAAGDAGRFPPLGDVNGDGYVANLDALVTQALFLRVIAVDAAVFDQGPAHTDGFRFADVTRDGFVSSLDALVMQSVFLDILPALPLRL